MSCWYLVHTKIRQERIACDNLQSQGHECYLPLLRSDEEPLFPRCLFVRLSADLASACSSPVHSASGVNRLFSHGQTPVKISDDMLADIRAQTESAMGPDAAYSMARGEDRLIALLNALSQQVTTPMPTTGPRPRAINLG